ncbi:alpha/beta hydrolase [Streptomyces sp. OF3]|uniref:Alpha/beta hydrolase n=1 Tax=Streptomyces alkaliterrae TaxID=2213162 RepID=A0A7W3WKT6_9ACTN|nr:alpha/beta fold hydrolase [Streptomyces alkaliterrae]MBB1254138.1 alpha/beta hydrolase [Streptomyces alkaliterrae]
MTEHGWGRRAGLAGAALGVVAAGVAVERLTVHRSVRRRARLALDAAGPYGTLRGTPGTAVADDGTELHYEVDEPAEALGDKPADTWSRLGKALRGGGDTGAPLTVVFSHGYCLTQDAWHFQREALRELGQCEALRELRERPGVRAVYWDQRSHGRSERGRAHAATDGASPVSIERLGRDLKAVLDAAAPEGPLILVGHSMGGMTMMALAAQYPEEVAERVVGAAFVGTSAGGLGEVTYGLPAAGVTALRRFVPGVLKALASHSALVERGRAATADLLAGLVKHYSFGDTRAVDPAVARFAERLIESTPIDVVAEFYPAFHAHEKREALAAFAHCPTLVIAGDRDLLTPQAHSEAIAAALPKARLEIVPETGHLLMLERPELLNERLLGLLAAATAPTGRRSARRR